MTDGYVTTEKDYTLSGIVLIFSSFHMGCKYHNKLEYY